jgi:tetratricopeptide (TPR) repeat protein
MRAVDVLTVAIALAPDRPQLYCERGRVWRSVDTYDEALGDFQLCLERARREEQPRLARDAQAELALTQARRAAGEAGDLRPALPILDEELGQPGAPPWLQCERGELALQYAAYDVAIESFSACRRTVADDFWQERSAVALAMSRAELAFAAGEEAAALEHLQEWAALDPQVPEPHCQIGDVHFYTLHRWEESLAAYQRCRELATEPGAEQWAITGIFSSEANMAVEAEDWDRALGAYEELIGQDPQAPHLHCERSEIYLTAGDLGRARDDAQTCLDLSGEDPDLRAWAQDLIREIDAR